MPDLKSALLISLGQGYSSIQEEYFADKLQYPNHTFRNIPLKEKIGM